MKLREQLERLEVSDTKQKVAANSGVSNSCTSGGCHTIVIS
ncbi:MULTISPECIES: hypothetical protein [Bacillales]|uniref:Lantibiotic n=1 Tax=Lysinibacillus louembei TaxID=1470088 RepID=A0ABZ0RYZ5_9BACI|nr:MULTISPECIES: hypothetical protein [Bacillales]WPK13453.1 hypothetical protein R6U77_07185 [Lysinibacillus louembei]